MRSIFESTDGEFVSQSAATAADLDAAQFNGSNGADAITLSAQSGSVVAQSGGVKTGFPGDTQLQVNALDGADQVTVHDLTGSGLQDLSINLAATVDGTTPDGQLDQVSLEGTQNGDNIVLSFTGTSVSVAGLPETVEVNNADPTDQLMIHGGDGDDTIFAHGGGTSGNVALTIDGGAGNDTIFGSDQNDTLLGGSGNDIVDGGRGNDTALLGSGNDTFLWDPGDASDVVEGQSGSDTLAFHGSNANESITITANGSRVALHRDVADVTMDLNSIETIDLSTLGGTDTVTIGDLTGTDLKQLTIDLGSNGQPDGQADVVTVQGTAGADGIKLSTSGTQTIVAGLAAETRVDHGENLDTVSVQAGAGNDTFDLSALNGAAPVLALDGGDGIDTAVIKASSAGDEISMIENGNTIAFDHNGNFAGVFSLNNVENLLIQGQSGDDTLRAPEFGFPTGVALTIDGGGGNDTIFGSDQNDTLLGGSGNDIVDGGRGNDTALLGSGNDTFQWDPGDASDVVEGQGGSDTLAFHGSNANESITITANGSRVALHRDVADVTMDLNSIETIDLSANGGTDTVTVGDPTGTGLKLINVDLGDFGGSGQPDGQADLVTVQGTAGADSIKLSTSGTETIVAGLAAETHVDHGENLDTLTVQGGSGNDRIDASGVAAGGPTLVLQGGDGNDRITGSAGNDVLDGGAGNDVLVGGGGHDIFVNGETVMNFDASQDQLDLRSLANGQSADAVLAEAHNDHGNVVFDFGSTEITLVGESVAQLHASDFILS